jgi:phage tail-like protein
VRLTSDGSATPAVHQIRLDLPRRTSLDDLPAVYGADPVARDFSERFLSLFDAELEDSDEVVARRAALLDASALPDDALGWLAGLIGVGFEAEMSVEQRRALIDRAPELFRRRGTPRGLVDLLSVALGVQATVEELGPDRPWGAVGTARVGSVRLFGRSRARMRLGTSRLGRAPLNARGNPDDDARLAGANRIRVHVAAGAPRDLVERVVRSQTPAHVLARVHASEPGFALSRLRLGVDTVLLAPAPAVAGRVRLGREGVLRGGRAARATAVVGRPLIVGTTRGMR